MTVEAFVTQLTDQRMWLRLWTGRLLLLPSGAKSKLSAEQRDFLRDHKAQLKTLAAAAPNNCLGWTQPEAQPTTQPQPQSQAVAVPAKREAEPEVYVRGTRITEAHVREAMEMAGDLHDYEAGRITKVEAYERARVRLRQLQDLYGVR